MDARKKLNLREKYASMTRDLAWETTYEPMDKVFPFDKYEGIRIHDWDKWEDPFRMTMDAYWKYQSEKERKLYAIIDSFVQNNGHLNVSDPRYLNALRLFLTGVTPLEYAAHRGYAHLGRHFRGAGARVAAQMQSVDELRHAQTQLHTLSVYNKYFHGFGEWRHMHDRVWYLSVPKSYFEDAMSAGPFEFITAISFSFEYVLTNLLFMPFMSGAAYNGDMATVTFGFSAQSDESRHMTLGLEVVKFLCEQDAGNIPILQKWLDKWFWRGFRLLTLVGMMMDYMLPKRVMSWAEAWEMYFEQAGGALFKDLERYGLRMPKYHEVATKTKDRITHEAWATFYNYAGAAGFHTWVPKADEMAWLAEKYPQTFERYYKPRLDHWHERQQAGDRFYNATLPMLCQTCQIPMVFSEPDDPTQTCYRESSYHGMKFHFCSDGCKDIFDDEPAKYAQAWLPVHQIYQGNCGGATLEDVLKWYRLNPGADNLDFEGSQDQRNWNAWKGIGPAADAA
ncbi:aromatic/alkene/methane monooxygenase hydroxylase/oxygenase subunit alpha [Cupriavidus necator]|uniref:YHS domain-containing protein n=1 Tax=Cupriavidus necator TaxID=106590 RepID=A0A367PFB9_CUPNE|nr:aromatic/alkene/methane monooxygenase hydroxylase/oxygenase subunit alpha [Cupriavidus necator]QQX87833.1 aromatic/alkene/methane monooxygenase hydroxylase/oxygenase subunit alpha [Cupriavidus necator]RCJ06233.1 YHS domain-containing protein [Cupriavidus necator]